MNQCVLRFLDGRPVVSALDVDVVLRRPELVTLWEVEQLRRLEPYGSGNSRPLFCLLGVTLDRVQGVGQNRHLKLRFSKGTVQLEGIFFFRYHPAVPLSGGGSGWMWRFICRSMSSAAAARCSCRWWICVRPCKAPPGRRSPYRSCAAWRRGRSLRLREALRILPSRQQCAAAWRCLRQQVAAAGAQRQYLPFLRQLSAAIPGADPFLRACFCLDLFCERGLLSREIHEENVCLRLCAVDSKVDLEQSPYWAALQGYIKGK